MPRKSIDNKKELILKTAEKMFANKGFDAASVDAIAREAGVNKALIYYYFDNKRAMLDALYENFFSEAMAMKKHYTADFTKLDILDSFMMGISLDFMRKNSDKLKIMWMEIVKSTGANSEPLFLKKLHTLFGDAFKALKKKGIKVKDEDTMFISGFFFGFIPLLGFFTLGDEMASLYKIDQKKMEKKFTEVYRKMYIDPMISRYLSKGTVQGSVENDEVVGESKLNSRLHRNDEA